jgi:hypothetical protein
MNSAVLQGNGYATTATSADEPPTVHALLRARTKYYERHVLAWYALGRVPEARAAWAAVRELRRP